MSFLPEDDTGIEPVYPAREFVTIPIIRGMTEVSGLINVIGSHAFIGGGYARYCSSPLLNPIKPEDIDLFVRRREYYEVVMELLIKQGFISIRETSISNTLHYESYDPKFMALPNIQVVKPVVSERLKTYGHIKDVMAFFDFSVCSVAINGKDCLADRDFVVDEANLRLRITYIIDPIIVIHRLSKYIAKGYQIVPTEAIKIYQSWDKCSSERKKELLDLCSNGG